MGERECWLFVFEAAAVVVLLARERSVAIIRWTSSKLLLSAGGEADVLASTVLVVLAEGEGRQDSQVGEGQGELLLSVACTEMLADTVARHQLISTISDGSY